MARSADATRWHRLLKRLKEAMSYRANPGCPGCLSPVMDDRGRPVVPPYTPPPSEIPEKRVY